MSLLPGSRLAQYDIVTPLGAGGMGEVYRAKDTKLGRDVALKILPASFTNDPERVARFRREAQVLASLNHPHIAQIHGLEEVNGSQFLVLELVDGESLDKRIARGPTPVDEAFGIAKQIAEALEAAHEKGIIHRDLKPANIAVTNDGSVKVLDFGLAKAVEAMSGSVNAMNSPTITSPAMMTGVGVIVGTAAYMAPEQARGRSVDKRSDIWAFGCVLYEMLTGRRAFDGDDVSITLAAVLKTDPDWQVLPITTPAGLRRLLWRCLNKDPKNRLQAIGDARVEMGELLSGVTEPATATPIMPAGPLWRRMVIPAGSGLTMGLAIAGLFWFTARSPVARPRVWRFQIAPPSTAALSINDLVRDVALTPDGSRLVYVGANGTTLFVRPLDQLEVTPLVIGGALHDPFVSPDGQWIGFFEGLNTLKKVAITGGPPMPVTTLLAGAWGATWAADGTIILGSSTGLKRVSADGGTPAVITRADWARGEAGHVWPELLPGGQAVLCTVTAMTGGLDAASIAALDLRSGRLTILLRGGNHAQYSPSGHLVYAASGTLRAVGFDLTRMRVIGPSSPMVPHVRTTLTGAVDVGLARDGTLAYVTGEAGSGLAKTLVWVDRQGRETPSGAPPGPYLFPRVSPDGTRVAVQIRVDQKINIWLWDLARAMRTRLTTELVDVTPVWLPDSRRVVFSSARAGAPNLFSQPADGTGTVDRLTESPNPQRPSAVSPDGTRVVFTQDSPKTGQDVLAVSLDGTHQILPLVQTPFNERNGIVSPDGRWLAYEADDSGSFEVYVRPFPDVNGGHWQVSTNGGTQPLWSRNGEELFYLAPNGALMRVAVGRGPAWTGGAATRVLEGHYVASESGLPYRNYDIAADGRRFLMVKAGGGDATGASPQIVVIQHFDEELKRLVPVK
jgi:serine/threonine-protein kinase